MAELPHCTLSFTKEDVLQLQDSSAAMPTPSEWP